MAWPGDFCRRAGVGLWFWLFLIAAGSVPSRGLRPAGAPAADGARQGAARTNELDAGERRPIIGSEEEPPGCGVAGG